MRRTSRGGWLSRLVAKRRKSWVGHPEFEPQNRKSDKSAPVTPCECRAEHGAPMCGILRCTRPSSHFTCRGARFLARFKTKQARETTRESSHAYAAQSTTRACEQCRRCGALMKRRHTNNQLVSQRDARGGAVVRLLGDGLVMRRLLPCGSARSEA